MSYSYYRKCVVCGVSRKENISLKFHRFPRLAVNKRNINQLRQWAAYCYPGQDFSEVDLTNFSKNNKMLCGRHFDETCYTGSDTKRLIRYAVPNKKLVEQVAGPSGAQLNIEHSNITLPPSPEIFVEIHSEPDPQITLPPSPEIFVEIHSEPDPQRPKPPTPEILKIEKPSESEIQIPLPATPFIEIHPEPGSENKNQRMSGILQSLKISRISQLNSRERKLYNRCRYLLKTVSRLRKQLKENKNVDMFRKIKDDENINKLFNKKISPSLSILLQGELQNGEKRLRGRRWTDEQKITALEYYKKSPSCYRLLNRQICLPSPSTLRNLLNNLPFNTGINEHLFETLRNVVRKQTDEENLCSLIFDEMSIRKHLEYNRRTDTIDGYQDHGTQGRTSQVASKALVFMVTGIRKKWKQPVAYYLSSSSVTADRLSVLIKEVVDACLKIGLNIVNTICDMDGINVKALELLGTSTEKPYFTYSGKEIVTIPDPPHLLKCFRNLFMKYNIECITGVKSEGREGKGIAKWKHIEKFFELDSNNPFFVFAPALTKHHLQPNGKEKMKVKLAAQIFSHSVAAGMFAKIAKNELPSEAATTALFLNRMDYLFDSFNAENSHLIRGKKMLQNISNKSPHFEFYEKMISFFKSMKFIGVNRPPPSQNGWIRAINGVKRLWENLKVYKIGSLATRRLNQDPLENFFGCVRHNCGSNYNPTVGQFVAGVKTSIISNLRLISKKTNCEQDNAIVMENFKTFLLHKKQHEKIEMKEKKSKDEERKTDNTLNINIGKEIEKITEEGTPEAQACAYVCGYIFKRSNNPCFNCKKALLSEEADLVHLFTEFKEYDNIHRLQYASKSFIACVEKCAIYLKNIFDVNGHDFKIKTFYLDTVKENIDFNFLNICPEHFDVNTNLITQSVFFICIKRFCVLKNREYIDEASQRNLRRKMRILQNI